MLPKIRYDTRIDVWSIGCLVRPIDQRGVMSLTLKQIYELATSSSLVGGVYDEAMALDELTTLLGPLPQEWIDSLGTKSQS